MIYSKLRVLCHRVTVGALLNNRLSENACTVRAGESPATSKQLFVEVKVKIDWKHLATTKGYKSIKQELISANKRACYRTEPNNIKFHWIICRAKHYAAVQGKTLEEVLNGWEEKRRKDSWLAFYNDSNLPKLNRKSAVRSGIKREIANIRFFDRDSPRIRRKRILQVRRREAIRIRVKKPKWSVSRKLHVKKLKEIESRLRNL